MYLDKYLYGHVSVYTHAYIHTYMHMHVSYIWCKIIRYIHNICILKLIYVYK